MTKAEAEAAVKAHREAEKATWFAGREARATEKRTEKIARLTVSPPGLGRTLIGVDRALHSELKIRAIRAGVTLGVLTDRLLRKALAPGPTDPVPSAPKRGPSPR